MAIFLIGVVNYIYISIKNLFTGLYYTRRDRSIYYIYINWVFNVARISRPK